VALAGIAGHVVEQGGKPSQNLRFPRL
jgi:hypothetical protein